MKREAAFIIAGVLSLIPSGVGAALGDGRTQYGVALILIALPFYLLLMPLLFLPVYALIERNKKSLMGYASGALIIGVGSFWLLMEAEGGITASVAGAGSICTAFMLVPLFEGRFNERKA